MGQSIGLRNQIGIDINKMRLVYFHIDELYRDTVVAIHLKKILKKNKIKVIFGNRRNYRLIKMFSWIFDAVIFPKPLFLSYAKNHKWNTNIYYLYTENIGIIANKKYPAMVAKGVLDQNFMEGETYCVDSAKRFFLWGWNSYNVISKLYPHLNSKLKVVGHPRHDQNISNKKYKSNRNKKLKIGILTRNCFINDYILENPLDNISKFYHRDIMYEFYKIK